MESMLSNNFQSHEIAMRPDMVVYLCAETFGFNIISKILPFVCFISSTNLFLSMLLNQTLERITVAVVFCSLYISNGIDFTVSVNQANKLCCIL